MCVGGGEVAGLLARIDPNGRVTVTHSHLRLCHYSLLAYRLTADMIVELMSLLSFRTPCLIIWLMLWFKVQSSDKLLDCVMLQFQLLAVYLHMNHAATCSCELMILDCSSGCN